MNRGNGWRVVSFIALLVVFGAPASSPAAGGEAAGEAEIGEIRITSVSLFKNGLGFVTGEAVLPDGGRGFFRAPAPVHGTFLARRADGRGGLVRATALELEISESVPAADIGAILEANLGEEVVLRISDDGPVSLINARILAAEPGASIVLLETSGGLLAIERASIRQVTLRDGPRRTRVTRPKKVPVLELQAENAGGEKVLVQYLTGGITWAPSYRVEIIGPARARLGARTEIFNEIGDLDGVSVTLVSGFPNIHFSAVPSPLALRGGLDAFLGALSRPARPARSDVRTQAVLSNIQRLETGGVDFTAVPEGAALEDLFFYEVENVSLPAGRRGHYPLYEIEVGYEHVYRWDIPDALDEQERYRPGPTDQEVWHCLRLANSGGVPWTTAPALTLREGRVMGQDILYFTSPGARTLLRVTRSVDIAVEEAEYEEERVRNAASFYGRSYDLVTVRGVLRASSFKAEDVTLSITRSFSGEFVSSAPAAAVEKTAAGLRRVNPRGRLSWELPLAAGRSAEIEYRYTVYVRD